MEEEEPKPMDVADLVERYHTIPPESPERATIAASCRQYATTAKGRQELVHGGTVEVLLKLTRCKDEQTQFDAVTALVELSADRVLLGEVCTAPVARRLLSLAHKSGLRAYALTAISRVCAPLNQHFVVEREGINAIIDMQNELINACIRADTPISCVPDVIRGLEAILCAGDVGLPEKLQNQCEAMRSGAMDAIIGRGDDANDEVRRQVALSLAALAGNVCLLETVLVQGMETLLRQAYDTNPHIRSAVATALASLAYDDQYRRELLSEDVLTALCALVVDADEKRELEVGRAILNLSRPNGLTFSTLTWTDRPYSPTSTTPSPRRGHSLTVLGHQVVLFGGSDDLWHVFNDIHLLDTECMSWCAVATSGTPPAGRAFHSADIVGRLMFVFGGRHEHGVYNDVHVLDLDTMMWSKPTMNGASPAGRYGHCTAVVGDQIFVFGGEYMEARGVWPNNTEFCDLHILETKTMTWSQLPVCGTPPPPRDGPTLTKVGHIFYMFGGFDETALGDLFTFDIEKDEWSQPTVLGSGPTPRGRHACVPLGDGRLVVFGGCTDKDTALHEMRILDTTEEQMTWCDAVVRGWPEGMRICSCVYLGDMILAFAGEGTLSDFTCYSLSVTSEHKDEEMDPKASDTESLLGILRCVHSLSRSSNSRVQMIAAQALTNVTNGGDVHDKVVDACLPILFSLARSSDVAVYQQSACAIASLYSILYRRGVRVFEMAALRRILDVPFRQVFRAHYKMHDDGLGPTKEITLPPGGIFARCVLAAELGTTFSWEFSTREHGRVDFAICWQASEEDENEYVVLPPHQCWCRGGSVQARHVAALPGVYTFVWSNTYDEKTLLVRMCVQPPTPLSPSTATP